MKCVSRILWPSLFSQVVFGALVNQTVDDDSTMIRYRGSWPNAKSAPSALDYGGYHMVSSVPGDTAVFTFTGVAVYYLAPLWPYAVCTSLSLDGGSLHDVNLTDPSSTYGSHPDGGSESSPWGVRWSATGLTNTTHTLVASITSGGIYVVVDGFTYTTNASDSSPSNASGSLHNASITNAVVGITVGVLLALAILGVGCWFYRRNRRRRGQVFRPVSQSRRNTSDFLEPEFGHQSPTQQIFTYNPQGYIEKRQSYTDHPSPGLRPGHESTRLVPGHTETPLIASPQEHASPVPEKTRMSFSTGHEDFTMYNQVYPSQTALSSLAENGPESASGSSSVPSTASQAPPRRTLADEKRLQREATEAEPAPPAYTKD